MIADDLGFDLWWEDSEGTRSAVEGALSSGIEAGLSFDEDSAIVTVAGTHDLAVTAEDAAGETQSTTDTVEVAAGDAVDVSLVGRCPGRGGDGHDRAFRSTSPASLEGAGVTVGRGMDDEAPPQRRGYPWWRWMSCRMRPSGRSRPVPATIDLVVESNAVEVGDATDVG